MATETEIVFDGAEGGEQIMAGMGANLSVIALATGIAFGSLANFVSDSAAASEAVTDARASLVAETVVASDAVISTNRGSSLAQSSAKARDFLTPLVVDAVGAQASAADAVTSSGGVRLRDTAKASDAVMSQNTARSQVNDSARAFGGFIASAADSVTDAASGASAATGARRVSQLVEDSAQASAAVADAGDAGDLLRDAGVASESVTDALHAVQLAEDWASGEGRAVAGIDGAIWTALSETFGMSLLDAPGHATIGVVDGLLCVGTEAGLFALDGPPAAGEVATGMMDVGGLKRLTGAYVGYQCDEPLVFEVANTEAGEEAPHEYEMQPRQAISAAPGRVKFGRGVKSRYWRFAVRSPEGQRFQLHQIALDIESTSRKI